MAHPLVNVYVHGVVEGVASPIAIPKSPSRLFNLRKGGGRGYIRGEAWRAKSVSGFGKAAGKQQSGGGASRKGHIAVVSANQHVYAVGAYIAQRYRQVRGNLTLHVEIPLQHVISVRVRFNRGGA